MNALAIKTIINESEQISKESGIYVGAFVNFPTSEVFSIQPELNYASGKYNYNDKVNFLHIPLLFKFEMKSGFSGFIGPESVILLNSPKPVNRNEDQEDQEDNFNKFMFGFTFGVAYDITDNLSIEGRPYFGISRFFDNGSTNYSRYNTFQVGLAYKF